MLNPSFTIKKSKGLRVCLTVFTVLLLISTLLFIPTFTTDKDSMMVVIICTPLTILFVLLTVSQYRYKIQINDRSILYVNELLTKRELHISEISTVSVNDAKGVTVYDREQKKIFFVPRQAENFLSFLVYLKQQNLTLQFTRPGSMLEQTVNEIISEIETPNEFPEENECFEKNYYVEKISPQLKKFRILSVSIPCITAILIFILSLLALKANTSFIRALFISGVFTMASLQAFLNIAVVKLLRRNIQTGAASLPAQITHFEHQNGTATPVYQFQDEYGLHQLSGLDSIKVKGFDESQWIGEQRQILYNAQFPAMVIDTDPSFVKTRSLVLPYISATILLFIGFVICLFSFLLWRIPEHMNTASSSTWVEQSYKKGTLTQDDVDSDTVQWICATYAIYTELNNKELGRIGGAYEDDEAIKEPIKIQLKDGWGISDRQSAASQINKLVDSGHREKYKSVISRMKKEGLLDLSRDALRAKIQNTENYYPYLTAYDAYKQLGENALNAWDYCRALQVLGDCYQAEYISLNECLDQSLNIAQKLQKDFRNWDEVADSYLYGYQFWKQEDPDAEHSDTVSRRDIYTDLKNTTDGPFSISFDIKLENTWTNTKKGNTNTKDSEDDSETAKTLKPDSDGYYSVKYDYNKGRTLMKAPEGFSMSEFATDTCLIFVNKQEEDFQSAQVTVTVNEIFDDFEQSLKTKAMNKSELLLENMKNIDFHDLQQTEIDGIKVTYIYYNYEDEAHKNKMCQMWWTVDNEYMITIDVSESAVPPEAAFVFDDSTMVQTIFNCVKK